MAIQNPPYTILSVSLIDNQPNLHFLRIRPNNFQLTLDEIFHSLVDRSWINRFTPVFRQSMEARVQPTIDKITQNLQNGKATSVDKNSGELIVSELSRKTVVNVYNYKDIPIAELFKSRVSGNSGFDFYSVNLKDIILFGEAKYVEAHTASKKALDQIEDFVINKKKDDNDLWEIKEFVTQPSIENYYKHLKGYIAAFSSKGEPDNEIIANIKSLNSYKTLINYSELICVAVDI